MKSVLWRVAKCLSYIEEARCLKVNTDLLLAQLTLISVKLGLFKKNCCVLERDFIY